MTPKRIVLGLTVLAFTLRVSRLDFQPLWGDEGWSFYFAQLPLPEMLALTAVDIHPPFYYALLQLWFWLTDPGPELGRLVSVWAGTLMIPLAYRLATAMTPARPASGLFAATVMSLAPMAVYYSQEVRMYAWVTLLGLAAMWLFWRLENEASGRWAWLGYGVVLALSWYTMYYALFLAVAQGVWLLWYRRQRIFTAPAFKGMVLALTLYLPWMLYAGTKLMAYVTQKADVEGYRPLNPLEFLSNYLLAFSVGHPSTGLTVWAGVGFIWLIMVAWGWWSLFQASQTSRRAAILLALYLLMPLILGWLVNLYRPFTPRFFERTLLIAAPAWWLLLGLGLANLWPRRRTMLTLALSFIFVSSTISLLDFYLTPRYPHEDYRSFLQDVAARATQNDLILASYQWQVGYYYAYLPPQRPQRYLVPNWGQVWGTDTAALRQDLTALLNQTDQRVWFPAHQTQGRIWENTAEEILAQVGHTARVLWYNRTTKVTLTAAPPARWPEPWPQSVNFANQVTATITPPPRQNYQSGRGLVPLQIRWQSEAQADYLLALQLLDETGRIWASHTAQPRAGQRPFSSLEPGEILLDQPALPLPAGLPPGPYQLHLSLLTPGEQRPLDVLTADGQPQGATVNLGQITVSQAEPALSAAAFQLDYPQRQRVEVMFGGQLALLAAQWPTQPWQAGDTVSVDLLWQSLQGQLPPLLTFIQLQTEAGQALAVTERPPPLETPLWGEGTLLRDEHRLRLPATLPPGKYFLAAGVLESDLTRWRTDGFFPADQVILAEIQIESRPRVFTPPQSVNPIDPPADFGGGELVGFTILPPTVRPGQPVTLTTHWRGSAGFNQEWVIFAQVVDEAGQIWGQRDQPPGNGSLPTTSWVPGEYLTDTRHINLRPETPPGQYHLLLGLYNPVNFQRVPLASGGDAIRLPLTLTVTQN
jgi:4-amino-4-deoxy-L-arabinose transferase-like glycosyltransferase